MKLTIAQKQLVRLAERCEIGSSGTHAGAGNVLLAADKAGESELRGRSTDLKLQVDTSVSASVLRPGSSAVNCKRLLGVARAMPEGSLTLEHHQERRLVISCSGSRQYALPTVDPADLPTQQSPHPESRVLKLEARILASLIERVQPSIAAGGRPYLEGVYLDYEDHALNAVVVGAHTIGIVTDKSIEHDGAWAALLPAVALKTILSLCSRSETVELLHHDPYVFARAGDTLIGSVLPNEPFVPWRNGCEGLSRTPVARVGAGALRNSVQALTVARQTRTSPISLVIKAGRLRVALVGEECDASDEVSVEPLERPELRVLARPEYVLEAIRGADATFQLDDTGTSIAISTDEYLGVISLVDPSGWPGAFA